MARPRLEAARRKPRIRRRCAAGGDPPGDHRHTPRIRILPRSSSDRALRSLAFSRAMSEYFATSGYAAECPDLMAQDAPAKASWPVLRSLANLRPSDLPADVMAGLTLAAIAIPEQMATARLGGFSPQ